MYWAIVKNHTFIYFFLTIPSKEKSTIQTYVINAVIVINKVNTVLTIHNVPANGGLYYINFIKTTMGIQNSPSVSKTFNIQTIMQLL